MRRNRDKTSRPANLASTASAVVALVAVAALMTSFPGAGVRIAMAEARVSPVETPTVRAVAEAVAAAARELVAGERITAALPADEFVEALAAQPLQHLQLSDSDNSIRSRPIDERLIDLPPPAC